MVGGILDLRLASAGLMVAGAEAHEGWALLILDMASQMAVVVKPFWDPILVGFVVGLGCSLKLRDFDPWPNEQLAHSSNGMRWSNCLHCLPFQSFTSLTCRQSTLPYWGLAGPTSLASFLRLGCTFSSVLIVV